MRSTQAQHERVVNLQLCYGLTRNLTIILWATETMRRKAKLSP